MLAAYVHERLPLRLLLPVSAGLALAAVGLETLAQVAIATATTCLLVAQFRVWDDLADRQRDAIEHPERVLVRAISPRPAVHVCVGLAAASACWIVANDGFGPALVLFIALNGAAAIWYGRRRSRTTAGNYLVLAKYPAFVAIAAGDRLVIRPGRTVLAMASAYLAACMYEAWHDGRRKDARLRLPLTTQAASYGEAPAQSAPGSDARDGGRKDGKTESAWAPKRAARRRRAPRALRKADGTTEEPMSPTEFPDTSRETIACYVCGSLESRGFISAEDDLTGKPGTFHFVRCARCGLAYQNPRIPLEHIAAYYDEEYIAHRRRTNWGVLTPLFERAMSKLDADKHRLVSRYVTLGTGARVLDVGCGVGTFLQRLRRECGVRAAGVDFKDLSAAPSFEQVEFHCGLFYTAPLPSAAFDLVTMWHFLEHDYDPLRSLRTAGRVMKPEGRLVIEVPRLDSRTFRWFGHRWPGLQAPQHTVLFTRDSLMGAVRNAGLEVVDYLPYGAFPAYFYLFTGAAFTLLKGRGLNLRRAIVPYFIGQALALPLLTFETRLNLAMQTIVCRRAS